MNQTDLIKEFINGATSGEVGNAKIVEDQLIHFSTPILQRYKRKFIFNESNYSDITRFLQRKILSLISDDKLIRVNKVLWNFDGKLEEYIK